jgi:hypothetical protein
MSETRVIQYEIKVDDAPVKSLRQQLREANTEVQNLAAADVVDEKKLQDAINKAAELKDKFGDANDAVKELATGSDFEKMKNSIGGVGDALMNLNFDKATQSAKNLTTTISSLNPATMATQFAAFGGTVMQLGRAVGMLTIKFVQMGIALLTNPIFLLVAAITAIVVGIVMLLDKLGFLQPILDALMKPIRALIDGFYALTDALGLTNKEGEETRKQVEESIAAYEEQAKVLAKTNSREEFIANDKLRRLKALDDGTQEYAEKIKAAERSVLQLKLDNFKEEVRLAENQMLLMVAKGAMTKAEYDKQKEQILDLRQQMRGAATDLFEFENKRQASALGSKSTGTRATAATVEEDAEVKYRLARARFLEDIENDLIADENARNIKQQQVRIQRAQEDLEASEIWATYTAEEQKKIAKKAQDDIQAIQDNFDADKRAKQEAEDAALLEKFKQFNATEQSILQDKFATDLDMLQSFLDAKLLSEEDFAAKKLELEQKLADDLNAIEQEKIDFQAKLREQQQNAVMDGAQDMLAAIIANTAEGSAASKAAAIAQATIDTYRAAQAAYASVVGVPVVGPALAVAAAASAVGMGIANVRNIVATQVPGGGGGGVAPSIQTPSMGQAQTTPQINMFQNEQSQGGQMSGVNKVTVVDYTDIQNTGNRVAMLQNAVSLG